MRGMQRRLFACLFASALLLNGCAAPNAQATQTRTSEIVELTVAARLLPTQNADVPPTPIPVTATTSLPTSTPNPVNATPNPVGASAISTCPNVTVTGYCAPPAPSATTDAFGYGGPPAPPAWPNFDAFGNSAPPATAVLPGSWVASSPALHIRFFSPPSLIEDPTHDGDHRYALASPSNVYDFEALDVYRFVGNRGGDFVKTWANEMDTYRGSPNVTALVVTSDPRQQQVGAFQGNIGQFHYFQKDNDLKVSGTMWVGQVGGDEALVIYRCTPDRESQLDAEMAQILRTIDFNAR